MKFISVNIECNLHTDRVLNLFYKEKPNVVCIQELLEDDVEFFKERFDMNCVYQPTSYLKNEAYQNLFGKKQGIAIFSKSIIDSGYLFYYGKEENILKNFNDYMSSEGFKKNYAFVWVKIKDNYGLDYKIITTHLPVTKEGESTPFQIEVANLLLNSLDKHKEFILCGDMNAPRGNETFTRIAARYKDNIPLEYKTSIDQNLHRVKGIMFMVDGLFTTPKYEASNVKLVDGVSDHMAIVADIEKIL